MRQTLQQIADLFGCSVEEFSGSTLRQLFLDAERYCGSVRVFWGLWTESQLDSIID
jgi:hypothetical protein